jgi:hypothetical protein
MSFWDRMNVELWNCDKRKSLAIGMYPALLRSGKKIKKKLPIIS